MSEMLSVSVESLAPRRHQTFIMKYFLKWGKRFIVFWFIRFENRIIITCDNIYKAKKIYN